jgi:microcystin degradation protein MlrC
MAYRVAIASLMQESNSFSPLPTTIETFRSYYLHRGDEILSGFGGARTEVPGFLSLLGEAGATAVPLVAAYAAASGAVTRAAFDEVVGDIERRLREAGPVDGVLLALHGALVVEDQPDGDGEIIERVRRLVPQKIPIGVSLDLHGHITPLMLQPNVFHVGYREYPHIDMFETGERTARLLLDTLSGRHRPQMALAKRPMIVSAVCARTTDGALRPVVERARQMEMEGAVLHASLFPVQPWIDVPDLGFAALICADDAKLARRAANELADMAWDARYEFDPSLTQLDDAIGIALSSEGLTVVSDAGDAPTGGSAADSTAVLEALIAAGADKSPRLTYLTLCDPRAVQESVTAGVGAEVVLSVGHCFSVRDGPPFRIRGVVRSLSDGVYRMRDAGAHGMEIQMGPTAVIGVGSISLLLRSRPSMEWDTAMYLSQGLEIRDAALVFVKSPSHFRSGFGPLADRILVANTPGSTAPDMRRIPFRHVTRPLYPLDEIS